MMYNNSRKRNFLDSNYTAGKVAIPSIYETPPKQQATDVLRSPKRIPEPLSIPQENFPAENKTPERAEFENSTDGVFGSEEEQTEHNLRASRSFDLLLADDYNDEDEDDESSEDESDDSEYDSSSDEELIPRRLEDNWLADDWGSTDSRSEEGETDEDDTATESDDGSDTECAESSGGEGETKGGYEQLNNPPSSTTSPLHSPVQDSGLKAARESFFTSPPEVVRIDAWRMFGIKQTPPRKNSDENVVDVKNYVQLTSDGAENCENVVQDDVENVQNDVENLVHNDENVPENEHEYVVQDDVRQDSEDLSVNVKNITKQSADSTKQWVYGNELENIQNNEDGESHDKNVIYDPNSYEEIDQEIIDRAEQNLQNLINDDVDENLSAEGSPKRKYKNRKESGILKHTGDKIGDELVEGKGDSGVILRPKNRRYSHSSGEHVKIVEFRERRSSTSSVELRRLSGVKLKVHTESTGDVYPSRELLMSDPDLVQDDETRVNTECNLIMEGRGDGPGVEGRVEGGLVDEGRVKEQVMERNGDGIKEGKDNVINTKVKQITELKQQLQTELESHQHSLQYDENRTVKSQTHKNDEVHDIDESVILGSSVDSDEIVCDSYVVDIATNKIIEKIDLEDFDIANERRPCHISSTPINKDDGVLLTNSANGSLNLGGDDANDDDGDDDEAHEKVALTNAMEQLLDDINTEKSEQQIGQILDNFEKSSSESEEEDTVFSNKNISYQPDSVLRFADSGSSLENLSENCGNYAAPLNIDERNITQRSKTRWKMKGPSRSFASESSFTISTPSGSVVSPTESLTSELEFSRQSANVEDLSPDKAGGDDAKTSQNDINQNVDDDEDMVLDYHVTLSRILGEELPEDVAEKLSTRTFDTLSLEEMKLNRGEDDKVSETVDLHVENLIDDTSDRICEKEVPISSPDHEQLSPESSKTEANVAAIGHEQDTVENTNADIFNEGMTIEPRTIDNVRKTDENVASQNTKSDDVFTPDNESPKMDATYKIDNTTPLSPHDDQFFTPRTSHEFYTPRTSLASDDVTSVKPENYMTPIQEDINDATVTQIKQENDIFTHDDSNKTPPKHEPDKPVSDLRIAIEAALNSLTPLATKLNNTDKHIYHGTMSETKRIKPTLSKSVDLAEKGSDIWTSKTAKFIADLPSPKDVHVPHKISASVPPKSVTSIVHENTAHIPSAKKTLFQDSSTEDRLSADFKRLDDKSETRLIDSNTTSSSDKPSILSSSDKSKVSNTDSCQTEADKYTNVTNSSKISNKADTSDPEDKSKTHVDTKSEISSTADDTFKRPTNPPIRKLPELRRLDMSSAMQRRNQDIKPTAITPTNTKPESLPPTQTTPTNSKTFEKSNTQTTPTNVRPNPCLLADPSSPLIKQKHLHKHTPQKQDTSRVHIPTSRSQPRSQAPKSDAQPIPGSNVPPTTTLDNPHIPFADASDVESTSTSPTNDQFHTPRTSAYYTPPADKDVNIPGRAIRLLVAEGSNIIDTPNARISKRNDPDLIYHSDNFDGPIPDHDRLHRDLDNTQNKHTESTKTTASSKSAVPSHMEHDYKLRDTLKRELREVKQIEIAKARNEARLRARLKSDEELGVGVSPAVKREMRRADSEDSNLTSLATGSVASSRSGSLDTTESGGVGSGNSTNDSTDSQKATGSGKDLRYSVRDIPDSDSINRNQNNAIPGRTDSVDSQNDSLKSNSPLHSDLTHSTKPSKDIHKTRKQIEVTKNLLESDPDTSDYIENEFVVVEANIPSIGPDDKAHKSGQTDGQKIVQMVKLRRNKAVKSEDLNKNNNGKEKKEKRKSLLQMFNIHKSSESSRESTPTEMAKLKPKDDTKPQSEPKSERSGKKVKKSKDKNTKRSSSGRKSRGKSGKSDKSDVSDLSTTSDRTESPVVDMNGLKRQTVWYDKMRNDVSRDQHRAYLEATANTAPKAEEDEFSDSDESLFYADTLKRMTSIKDSMSTSLNEERQQRKVQRAARKLQKQREYRRLRIAQEIQRHLQEVDVKQKQLENRGVEIEEQLRSDDKDLSADATSEEDNDLMQEWFNLVNEKNALLRYESELMVHAKELELEDRQSRLEQELRDMMTDDSGEKTGDKSEEEKRILEELLEAVKERDNLVSMLEQERLREKEEDRDMYSVMSAKGFILSPLGYTAKLQAERKTPVMT